MRALVYRVLACTLLRMPAYTNLALEPPYVGLWPDWEGVCAWLEVQLPAEVLAQWDAHWATPVKDAMSGERTAVRGRIKALLAECIAGRPAHIDSVTVTNSLACFQIITPWRGSSTCSLTLLLRTPVP